MWKIFRQRCGLAAQSAVVEPVVQVDPATADAQRLDRFSDRVHAREAHLNGWFDEEHGELIAGFPVLASDTLVDVGCNDGYFTMFCANRGAEIIAVDVDQEALDRLSRALAQSAARAYRCVLSDAHPLPLPAGLADKVVCTEVLEHVDDPGQLLAEFCTGSARMTPYTCSVFRERSRRPSRKYSGPRI